jgi:hypothetical protein
MPAVDLELCASQSGAIEIRLFLITNWPHDASLAVPAAAISMAHFTTN